MLAPRPDDVQPTGPSGVPRHPVHLLQSTWRYVCGAGGSLPPAADALAIPCPRTFPRRTSPGPLPFTLGWERGARREVAPPLRRRGPETPSGSRRTPPRISRAARSRSERARSGRRARTPGSERRRRARPRTPVRSSLPCGTRAARPRTAGRRTEGPWRRAPGP